MKIVDQNASSTTSAPATRLVSGTNVGIHALEPADKEPDATSSITYLFALVLRDSPVIRSRTADLSLKVKSFVFGVNSWVPKVAAK